MFVLLTDDGCIAARQVRPRDRLAARLRARRLDRELACGACPDAAVGLALRARLLVRTPMRRDLAASAQRVLAIATRTSADGRLPVPVCADRVRACAAEFEELIARLLADGPVAASGIAQASVLLSDATGPLYHRAVADDLRARVREAARALSPLGSCPPEHRAPES